LLFWKDLTGYLSELGFVLNPYDNCVANKMVEGSQCTFIWHVDNLKISHINQEVLEDLVSTLNVTVTRGDVHDYLGMTLDYSTPGQVSIRMDDYVRDLLEEAPKDMDGTAATPAAKHLFTVNADPEYLDDATSELFHHMTAKLLFLCKRARPNIQTAVAFLTTRVKRPDKDNYKILGRVIKSSCHHSFYGQDISWRLRVMVCMRTKFFRTTRVPFCWRRMDGAPVVAKLDTSISAICS
jgi:hypothetical protein